MSDNRPPEKPPGSSASSGPGGSAFPKEIRGTTPGVPPRSEKQIEQSLDVYAQLFQAANRDQAGGTQLPRAARLEARLAPKAPLAPETLAQSGLSLMQVCDLILKQLYLQGAALGVDL